MKAFCTLTLTTIALLMGSTASAAVLADGIYKLGNHPAGSAAPPLYGLRLDGLGGSGIYTFDFENNGAAMYMDLDTAGGTIHIYGQAYGGLDTGTGYDGTLSGLWDIDFTYTENVTVGSNVKVAPSSPNNNGSITPNFTAGIFTNGDDILLVDKSDGAGDSFFIDTNHRGAGSTFSGWGWLNHETGGLDNHIAASDWLFTVGDRVPVPGAVLLGAIGLSLIGSLKRRFN